MGILTKIFDGNKNQKIPTPKVKKAGSIKVVRVMFHPKPS
jgi:hypothetical protein